MLLPLLLAPALAGRPTSVTGYTDSATHLIRCHWARERDAELCPEALAAAEAAWDAQVGVLGFAEPLPDAGEGGSDALDLYLVVEETGGAGIAWVECDGGDGSCLDSDPTDGRAAAPSYIQIDARTEDLSVFVVHEFNHVCQYATDYAEPFLVLWEGTAVSAERWTLPDWTQSTDDIADYQATPWLSAVLQDGYLLWDDYAIWSYYEYGSMVWVTWLDHRWGDGAGSLGPPLWEAVTQEGNGTEPDVLDAWDGISGDWAADMMAFALARAQWGRTPESPDWIAFAGAQAGVAREQEDLPLPAHITPLMPPFPLGATYVGLQATPGDRLQLVLDADPSVDWGLVVVESGGGAVLQPGDDYGPVVTGDLTVGVVNLGTPGMDADDVLSPASFVLDVRTYPVDSMPADTGADTAGDTETPKEEPPGCGCGTGGAGWGAGGLALLALAARRRRAQITM